MIMPQRAQAPLDATISANRPALQAASSDPVPPAGVDALPEDHARRRSGSPGGCARGPSRQGVRQGVPCGDVPDGLGTVNDSPYEHGVLHDPLTGLPNRAGLVGWLDDVLAYAGVGQRLGICLINLQRVTAVNERLGHDKGDHLVLLVAQRLAGLAESGGHFLAHLGGGEFVFVVVDTTVAGDVAKVACQALDVLPDSCRIDGDEVPVLAKAGIVERPALGAGPAQLLRAAGVALSWSRKNRCCRLSVFDPDRDAIDMARHHLADAMPAALERGEFTLAYQPLIRLGDGGIVAVEALARWRHPTYGQISPSTFIPLAERTGLIVPLGQHLLEQACAQASSWRRISCSPPVLSVNVAVSQLRAPGLADTVAAILDRSGLPPQQLQLEITEDDAVVASDGGLHTLHALADLGIGLAIDDFGTGFSNLANLSVLPVHSLKLDASFLKGLDRPAPIRRSNATILPRVIQLGHDLQLSVTAEGIETAAQAQLLTELGCDLGQGFHLALPTTPEHFTQLIRTGPLSIPRGGLPSAGVAHRL